MSDPESSYPPEPSPMLTDRERELTNLFHRSWAERGGIRGFFNGGQSLAMAFWFLGVLSSVLGLLAVYVISNLISRRFDKTVMASGLVLIACVRVCSWYSILKCRRNTTSDIYSALALMCTVFDMSFGAIRSATLITMLLY